MNTQENSWDSADRIVQEDDGSIDVDTQWNDVTQPIDHTYVRGVCAAHRELHAQETRRPIDWSLPVGIALGVSVVGPALIWVAKAVFG